MRHSATDFSIVMPVLNESGIVREKVSALLELMPDNGELIVVDGGSKDSTLEELRGIDALNFKCLTSEQGRSAQMNAGANKATGRVLLFLHVDTDISQAALEEFCTRVVNQGPKVHWGRFDLALDDSAYVFRVIGWFINRRSRLTGVATGDQGIFVSSQLFHEIGGYPDQPLMEDVELCKQLKIAGVLPIYLNSKLKTSARKWKKEGVVRTVLLMWRLRAQYALGADPKDLVRVYYKS